MSDELFAAMANLAGAVGRCENFLSGIKGGPPTISTFLRRDAGRCGKDLSLNFETLRKLIGRGAVQNPDPGDQEADDDPDLDDPDDEDEG